MVVGSARSARGMASQQHDRARGMFCPLYDFVYVSILLFRLKKVVLMSAGFVTTPNEAVKNCKALAEAAEQKEADRVAMSEAISALC